METILKTARVAAAAALALLPCATFALDLIGAYERARRTDPTVLAADEAVIAGREKAVQGRALLLPQVGLGASYTHVSDKSSNALPPELAQLIKPESSGGVRKVELQFKQPLYDAEARSNKKQLRQQTELAEITYRNAQQELIERVAETYFNVLLAEEQLRVTRAEKAAVQMQRDRAKARFDVGRGKVTDVQETQARYDGVLAKEVQADSALALRRTQFEELTGAPAEGLHELAPGFVPAPPQPEVLAEWQGKGREQNSRVLAKRSQLAIADAEIGKYKLAGRPTLELVAGYSDKSASGGLSPTIASDHQRTATVGLQFSVPLFAGGGIESRERESIAKKRQAEQELAAAQRDARLQVQDAYLSVTTGVARIAALEQSRRSAETALEATTLGRDVGTRTELDVLDAQQRLFSSQLDLAQARNDYLLGRIRLASAAGELHEGDLRSLNAMLRS